MADALLRLKIEGAQEALAQVTAIQAKLAGAPGGVIMGQGGPTATMSPPVPSVPAVSISSAAATTGTPAAGAPTVSLPGMMPPTAGVPSMPAPSSPPVVPMQPPVVTGVNPFTGLPTMLPSPGTPPQPSPVPAFGWQQAGQLVGGYAAYHQLAGMANTAASGYGQAAASGIPFERPLYPQAVGMGITMAAAAAGFAIGGPIGGMVFGGGAMVAQSAQSFLEPIADRSAASNRMARIAAGQGYGGVQEAYTTPEAEATTREMLEGRGYPRGLIEQAFGQKPPSWVNGLLFPPKLNLRPGELSPELAPGYVERLNKQRWSGPSLDYFGKPSKYGGSPDELEFMGDTDPFHAATYARDIAAHKSDAGRIIEAADWRETAAQIEERGLARSRSEYRRANYKAKAGLAFEKASFAGEFGTLGEVALETMRARSGLDMAADFQEAMSRTLVDPAAKDRAMIEAESLRIQSARAPMAVFDAARSRIDATNALQIGRAGRGRGDMITALESAHERDSRYMNEMRGAGLLAPGSPAELSMTAGLEANAFQRVEIERTRALLGGALTASSIGLGGATAAATGGLAGREAGRSSQIEELNAKIAALTSVIQDGTRRGMAPEAMAGYQINLNQLETAKVKTKAQLDIESRNDQLQSVLLGNYESALPARTGLIRGENLGANLRGVTGQAEADLAAAKGALAATPEGAPDREQRRKAVADAMLQVESARSQSAIAPTPYSTQKEFARLGADIQIAEMGYGGSLETVRSSLAEMIGVNDREIGRIESEREKAKKDGTLTEKTDFEAEQRIGALRVQGYQMRSQYDQGWTGRLISEAFGMEGAGLLTSRVTRQEASRAGVDAAPFGGSQEQTERWLKLPARYMSRPGTGNPRGAADAAMLSSEGGTARVQLDITIRDDNGVKLKENSVTIDAAKTAEGANQANGASAPSARVQM